MFEELTKKLQRYAEEVAGTVLEVVGNTISWTPIILKCCPYLDITLLRTTEHPILKNKVNLVQGSPVLIPFKDNFFNVVLTALVVKSVNERVNNMLKEFNRILVEHGMLILVEKAIGTGELGGWLEKLDETGFIVYDWTIVGTGDRKTFIIQAFK